jgi:parvulin-like peptidyl-prolyl isomerase
MKTHVSVPILVVALAASLAACSYVREGMEGQQDIVAQAAGYNLTVDKAAELVAVGVPRLETPEVAAVDRIADLWIGYTLLAVELASPDTFANVDVSPITRLPIAQEIVWELHEEVITGQVDTAESLVRAAYEREQPYTRVNVLHILVSTSAASTQATLDSLQRFADSIRARAAAGEDFESLAREYSEDPSSASQGGSLGWVDHGRLLPELEPTVFAMQVGAVSETVRSRLGYHIFKVIERRSPEFESIREQYLETFTRARARELEDAYLDSLFEAADVRFARGAIALVDSLADAPGLERLGPATRSAVLVRYRGGKLTVGEWADFVKRGEPQGRQAFARSDSATVHHFLRELVRNKLLVKAALDMGYEITEEQRETVYANAQRELASAAVEAGMQRERLLNGEQAVAEAVEATIHRVGRRTRRPWSLDRVTMALRLGQPYQVFPSRFPRVIERVAVIRETLPTPNAPPTEDSSDDATDAEN